jgi:hypothetical protein
MLSTDTKVFNQFLAYWIKQNKPKREAYANGGTFREVSKSGRTADEMVSLTGQAQHEAEVVL